MTDWGVPNWTDEAAYPKADGLTRREWWWEFTRRRPDYRELWLKWAPINKARIMHDLEDYERLARDQGSTIDVFLDSAPTDDPDLMRRRFGLSVIHNPAQSLDDRDLMHLRTPASGYGFSQDDAPAVRQGAFLAGRGDEALSHEIERRTSRAEAEEAKGLYSYAFDLSEPLEPQLQHARDHLTRIQRGRYGNLNIRKLRPDKWPLYLRALEALDAGPPTYLAMASVFWPDEIAAKPLEYRAAQTCKVAVNLRNNFPI